MSETRMDKRDLFARYQLADTHLKALMDECIRCRAREEELHAALSEVARLAVDPSIAAHVARVKAMFNCARAALSGTKTGGG